MSIFRVRSELVVAPVGTELVVYDPKLQAAHNLTGDAVTLFEILKTGGVPEDSETNRAILALFAEKGILEESGEWNRRDLLLGAVKVATFSLVASVALPTPAAAQSGVAESDCEMSGGSACGQLCVGPFPFGSRVCSSVTGVSGGLCGCVATTTAVCGCV